MYTLHKIHELTSWFSPKMIYAGLPCLCGHQCFFCGCASNGQDSPKASPRVVFNWKNFTEQLKLILKWIRIEKWTRPSMLSSMCQHEARLQFDSSAAKHSLCGSVMIHDGLNLRYLDQCHGVRSHFRISYLVIRQPEFDPWVYNCLHPCLKPSLIYAGLPRKAFPQKLAKIDTGH